MHLSRALLSILSPGVQVNTWPRVVVETQCVHLSCLKLRRDIVSGVLANTVLPTPGQRALHTLLCVGDVPLCGAEVAEKALPRQPHLLLIVEGLGFGALLGGDGDGLELFDVGKKLGVFGLLLGSYSLDLWGVAIGLGVDEGRVALVVLGLLCG